MNDRVIAVIPARYASTRLPGKPLIYIAGKPLIRWVWERVSLCGTLDDVIIATDDERIGAACEEFGAKWVMTSPDCPSGSDRIAEAVRGLEHGILVNVQGDEPLIEPGTIDACVQAMLDDGEAGVVSAMTAFGEDEDYRVPSMVKVVTDLRGYAMYFSRAPIPDCSRLDEVERRERVRPMKHVGLYVYRRRVLEDYVRWPQSRYEVIEKLEQLRLLEAGVKIRMVEIGSGAVGVDTPEDVAIVERLLRGA